MAKQKATFEDFLMEVKPELHESIISLNDYLVNNGCKANIEQAKSGYTVSYKYDATKKSVINFVFRKAGLIIRIYGDNVGSYTDFLQTIPESMVKAIDKSSICKRLVDPTKCSSTCVMGYDFKINDVHYQKCRYNGFMFLITNEIMPYLKTFIQKELDARAA